MDAVLRSATLRLPPHVGRYLGSRRESASPLMLFRHPEDGLLYCLEEGRLGEANERALRVLASEADRLASSAAAAEMLRELGERNDGTALLLEIDARRMEGRISELRRDALLELISSLEGSRVEQDRENGESFLEALEAATPEKAAAIFEEAYRRVCEEQRQARALELALSKLSARESAPSSRSG